MTRSLRLAYTRMLPEWYMCVFCSDVPVGALFNPNVWFFLLLFFNFNILILILDIGGRGKKPVVVVYLLNKVI